MRSKTKMIRISVRINRSPPVLISPSERRAVAFYYSNLARASRPNEIAPQIRHRQSRFPEIDFTVAMVRRFYRCAGAAVIEPIGRKGRAAIGRAMQGMVAAAVRRDLDLAASDRAIA